MPLLFIHKQLRNNLLIKLCLVWILIPSFIFLFYSGNYGRLYDYYLNPLLPAFFILFAAALYSLWKFSWGKVIVFLFFVFFLDKQLLILPGHLTDELKGYNTIALGNQKKAIDGVYQDSKGKKFNIDVYVPPVIPYTYDYLFKWYGEKKYKLLPEKDLVPTLYTLYEYDSKQQRLDAWLARQDGSARIEKTATFGGITVNKRERY